MDKLLEKIRKLQAKALGTDNEAEAAAFAAKVQNLLAQHNLDLSDIEQMEEVFGEEDFGEKYIDPWRRRLAAAVARYYMCEFCNDMIWSDKKKKLVKSFTIMGKKHNRVVAISMYHYLTTTTVRLASQYARAEGKKWLEEVKEWKREGYSDTEAKDLAGDPPTLRRSALGFERGCGERLATRLNTLRAELRSKPNDPLPALIVSELKETQVWVDNNIKLVASKGLRGSGINEHGVRGAVAADTINLNPQVSGSKSGRHLT